MNDNPSRRRPPPPHAQIHLPALEPDEALRFVTLLERISQAVWRAHGTQMSERLIDQHLSHSLAPVDNDDSDLPF